MLRKRYVFVLFKDNLNGIDKQRSFCLSRSSFTTSNSDTCMIGNSRGHIGLYYRRSRDQRIYRDDGAHAFLNKLVIPANI